MVTTKTFHAHVTIIDDFIMLDHEDTLNIVYTIL